MRRGGRVRVGRPAKKIEVSEADLKELSRRANSRKSTVAEALRARIVLLAHQGKTAEEIGRELGVSAKTARKWRSRFVKGGIKGLEDKPRSGRRPKFSPEQGYQIIAIACELAPTSNGMNGWTIRRIRDEAIRRGVVSQISESTIWRILNKLEIKPYKVRGWMHSPDPAFREKVNEITSLYVKAPKGAIVICVDEKTGMQAVERRYADKPTAPGRPLRREFEYRRHGTQSLIAGFVVHSGKVLASCGDTRGAEDIQKFMNMVAAEYPDKEIHVIWDNLNIHKGERWEGFNEKHGGRFHFHYTPVHASWVNQIEIWFHILSKKCLKHGSFKSIEELRKSVMEFINYWNESLAHPFRWTFTGYPLQA